MTVCPRRDTSFSQGRPAIPRRQARGESERARTNVNMCLPPTTVKAAQARAFAAAQQGVFEYRLCPYDAFTQDGRSLGGYKGWSDAAGEGGGRTMVFDGGEECDGTPRKASVTFECGEEDKLLETTEPSTCVYSARFSTPSACSTVSVREQHDALAAAAKEAGLPYEPDEAVSKLLAL